MATRSAFRKWFTRLSEGFLVLVLLGGGGPFLLALALRWVDPPTTTVLLARAGERLWEGKRPVFPYHLNVSRDKISINLRMAVVAAEDGRFYRHNGFDLKEIADAIDDYDRGKRLRGASTISQQTAKNLFLWEGRSFIRKGLEAYFTIALEKVLSKERILDLYLNAAEWGDGVFGAEAAARYYFHKPAADLSREEAARLAAVLPNPREWSPRGAVAARRARSILGRMTRPPER